MIGIRKCIVSNNSNFSESNTKVVINGEIREKATIAPSLLNALSIELEITQKSQMSTNMFARLKMAYAIKLRDLLKEKLGLKTGMFRYFDI